VLRYGALPAFTITLSSIGSWLLMMRNNMINVLAEEYITLAIAKGLPMNRIKRIYAARNAILPSVTGFAMSFGFIVGGGLITEMVFAYPGMGYMLYQAVNAKDYPLMQAIFLIIAASVLIANFIADIRDHAPRSAGQGRREMIKDFLRTPCRTENRHGAILLGTLIVVALIAPSSLPIPQNRQTERTILVEEATGDPEIVSEEYPIRISRNPCTPSRQRKPGKRRDIFPVRSKPSKGTYSGERIRWQRSVQPAHHGHADFRVRGTRDGAFRHPRVAHARAARGYIGGVLDDIINFFTNVFLASQGFRS